MDLNYRYLFLAGYFSLYQTQRLPSLSAMQFNYQLLALDPVGLSLMYLFCHSLKEETTCMHMYVNYLCAMTECNNQADLNLKI
jgi:hypothetical protein